jgi:MT-A70
LFLRGNLNRRSASVRQLVIAPIRDHSRKPAEVRERIMALVDGPYLEMFARERCAGWDTWGLETEKFDRPASVPPIGASPDPQCIQVPANPAGTAGELACARAAGGRWAD